MIGDKSAILRDQYRLRFERRTEYRSRVWKVLSRYFAQWVPPKSRVMDVGSGWGEFINQINASEKYSMDLNPDAKHQLAGPIAFLNQDCAQKWPIVDDFFDVVFTSNFLEHLETKERIDRTLAEAYRCLRPGGTLICLGPNCKYLHGAYWDFWDHSVPITDASLCEALSLQQFQIETCIPRFLPYSMSTGLQPPMAFVTIYLKLPIFWPIFGKQFLIIAKK